METTARFAFAITKLYKAFHNNTLHPECSCHCAVGTILDGNKAWQHLSDHHGSLQLNYVGKVHQALGKKMNGYTPTELMQIEASFLQGCGYQLPLRYHHFSPKDPCDKYILFDGLCAAVDTLCKLDGITNSMDVSVLFKYNTPLQQEVNMPKLTAT